MAVSKVFGTVKSHNPEKENISRVVDGSAVAGKGTTAFLVRTLHGPPFQAPRLDYWLSFNHSWKQCPQNPNGPSHSSALYLNRSVNPVHHFPRSPAIHRFLAKTSCSSVKHCHLRFSNCYPHSSFHPKPMGTPAKFIAACLVPYLNSYNREFQLFFFVF